MPSITTIRRRSPRVSALVAVVAGAIARATMTAPASAAVCQLPPEWTANAGAWPAFNHDLANTRATPQTPITAQTVSKLSAKWKFAFKGASGFGAFASTPISLNGTVDLQDLASDVVTGKTLWSHKTPAGINSFPAADGDTLLVASAAAASPRSPSSSSSPVRTLISHPRSSSS